MSAFARARNTLRALFPATEVRVNRTDGRAHHAVFGTAALALLVTAVCAVVVGIATAAPAQAAPKTPMELGLGARTVEIASVDVPAAEKARELVGAGTSLGDALSGSTVRKPTPIRVAAPAPRPASSSASRSTSGSSGWSTARVSWYGPGFYGNTMAGGGTLTPDSMVVAHRSLAFGTRIQFEYNGHTCTAVVQDRGPYVGDRTFDLGPGTARALGFSGVGTVKYRILGR